MTEDPQMQPEVRSTNSPISVQVNVSRGDESYAAPSLVPSTEALRPSLCLCKCGSESGGGSGSSAVVVQQPE